MEQHDVVHVSAWTARLSASEIPVSLSLLQGLFVGVVVTLAPIIAAGLLWTPFYRIGSWLLLAIAGSLLLQSTIITWSLAPIMFLKFPLKGGACFSKSPLT